MDIHARLWGEPQPPDHQERGGTALKEKIYAAFAKNAKSMEGLRNNTVQYVPGVLKISKALILSPEDYDKLAEDISPEYPFLKDKSKKGSPAGAGVSQSFSVCFQICSGFSQRGVVVLR